MRSMRTVAGLLNIALGLALALVVATVVTLDFPANAAAYIVAVLLVLAGVGILARASWGAALGQWLGIGGMLLGLALLVGAAVAWATVSDWAGLVAAVLAALGIPLLTASGLVFMANRRARRNSAEP